MEVKSESKIPNSQDLQMLAFKLGLVVNILNNLRLNSQRPELKNCEWGAECMWKDVVRDIKIISE